MGGLHLQLTPGQRMQPQSGMDNVTGRMKPGPDGIRDQMRQLAHSCATVQEFMLKSDDLIRNLGSQRGGSSCNPRKAREFQLMSVFRDNLTQQDLRDSLNRFGNISGIPEDARNNMLKLATEIATSRGFGVVIPSFAVVSNSPHLALPVSKNGPALALAFQPTQIDDSLAHSPSSDLSQFVMARDILFRVNDRLQEMTSLERATFSVERREEQQSIKEIVTEPQQMTFSRPFEHTIKSASDMDAMIGTQTVAPSRGDFQSQDFRPATFVSPLKNAEGTGSDLNTRKKKSTRRRKTHHVEPVSHMQVSAKRLSYPKSLVNSSQVLHMKSEILIPALDIKPKRNKKKIVKQYPVPVLPHSKKVRPSLPAQPTERLVKIKDRVVKAKEITKVIKKSRKSLPLPEQKTVKEKRTLTATKGHELVRTLVERVKTHGRDDKPYRPSSSHPAKSEKPPIHEVSHRQVKSRAARIKKSLKSKRKNRETKKLYLRPKKLPERKKRLAKSKRTVKHLLMKKKKTNKKRLHRKK